MKIRHWLTSLLLLPGILPGRAGAATPLTVPRLAAPPAIDGVLTDGAWKNAVRFDNFRTMSPDAGRAPTEGTEVFLACDRSALYIGVRCRDRQPAGIKAAVAGRDTIAGDDWVSIELDTFNDAQSSYLFMVNPLGVQADGMMNKFNNDASGYGGEDFSFDTVWASRGRLTAYGWEAEAAIPFKNLRFPGRRGLVIGVGFRRSITRRSEVSSFPAFDPGRGSWMVQRQPVEIEEIAFRPGLQVIPAVTHSAGRDLRAAAGARSDSQSEIGLTGKFGLTPALTLDWTVNPDFSQVESDAGQIDVNLRNALYYPEKRPFFLEGKENYSMAATYAGYTLPFARAVNTRTIVSPSLGLKLTGKVAGAATLDALLAVDEYRTPSGGEEAAKARVGVLRIKRALRQDGYLGLFLTDREQGPSRNRVLGTDGRLRLNGHSRLEYHAFLSRSDGDRRPGAALSAEQLLTTRRVKFNLGIRYLSPGFRSDVGYLARTGVFMLPLDLRLSFFPRSSLFQRADFLYVSQQTLDLRSRLWETFNWIGWEIYLARKTWFYFGGSPASEVYRDRRFGTSYMGAGIYSQPLNSLYLELTGNAGRFIYYDPAAPLSGKGKNLQLGVNLQPGEHLSLRFTLAYADLADAGRRLYACTILRPSAVWQLDRRLSLRAVAEYNSFRRRLTGDFLASWTLVPGTVLQAGYGSVWEKDPADRRPATLVPMSESRRSLFLKASYLWRL